MISPLIVGVKVCVSRAQHAYKRSQVKAGRTVWVSLAPLELVIGLDGAGAGPAQDHSPRLTGMFIKPYELSTNPAPYSFGLIIMSYSLAILYIPDFLRSFYCRGY